MILSDQYKPVQHSRKLLLEYLGQESAPALTATLPGLEDKCIRDLLVHIAASYLYWIGYFALGRPEQHPESKNYENPELIRQLFITVDEMMVEFFQNYSDTIQVQVPNPPVEWGSHSATPLEAFTQAITHEYHHKGQIVMMCRLLGFTPPDTDARRAFPGEC